MENVEEPTVSEWVKDLKAALASLSPSEANAEIAGNLAEIINAFNEGRTAKSTAERILKQA